MVCESERTSTAEEDLSLSLKVCPSKLKNKGGGRILPPKHQLINSATETGPATAMPAGPERGWGLKSPAQVARLHSKCNRLGLTKKTAGHKRLPPPLLALLHAD